MSDLTNKDLNIVISAAISLDDMFLDDHWSETIGSLVRDEVKRVVLTEVRTQLKASPGYKKLIRALKDKALNELRSSIGDS